MTVRRLRPAVFALVAVLAVGAAAAAAPSILDLDARSRKDLIDAARSYFDLEAETVYTPRKNFKAQLEKLQEKGMDALKDASVLKQIVYQGRDFGERFSDKGWQKSNDVTEYKTSKALYRNVKSESYWFTYTEPRGYPKETKLEREIPRDPPLPLLLVFHDAADTIDKKNDAEPYPGEAALTRLYPKESFGDLYDQWFTLAPVAPRALFVQDGQLQHRFSTMILREFWRRYHVDFDRFVVDGKTEALQFASIFPHLLAGIVLRGGTADPALVRNYASVPIYVVGDPALKKTLDEAGHPDVTVGDAKGLWDWLQKRQRKIPRSFHWNIASGDHIYANWINVVRAIFEGPSERSLDVTVLDTKEDPNTIKIDAKGVEEIEIFLNDEILDLDRDVRLLVNGEERKLGKLPREFMRLFEREPKVRENMYFGWLYPVYVGAVDIPAAAKPTTGPATAPAEAVKGTPADEQKASIWWQKAEEAEAGGDLDKAKQLWELIRNIGQTSFRAKAEEKLASSKGSDKGSDPGSEAPKPN